MFSCSPALSTQHKCCPGSFPWLSQKGFPPQVTCPAPRHSSHVPHRNSHLTLLRSADILMWQKSPGISDKNKRFGILHGFLLSLVKTDHCTKFSVRKKLKQNIIIIKKPQILRLRYWPLERSEEMRSEKMKTVLVFIHMAQLRSVEKMHWNLNTSSKPLYFKIEAVHRLSSFKTKPFF